MSKRDRYFGLVINTDVPRLGLGQSGDSSASRVLEAHDTSNGPRSFTPADLVFGSETQTLEELKAELERSAR